MPGISVQLLSSYLWNISGPIKCATNSDCPDYLACGEDEECVEPPCPNCTANAHCEGSNHIGTCICNLDYVGDPYLEGCQKGKQRWSHHVVRISDGYQNSSTHRYMGICDSTRAKSNPLTDTGPMGYLTY